ncbi:hypothetical protein [Rhodoferax antarcticus]|uniref:Alginate export domain-containing protein n=2 Tax=Rhodoferax antarcticus ANT.BR TaxID=1111071 RepID=A0A1Q8YH01_9BURK|nr:hypothetical protein [Rhodoferax antarcticus]OLP07266.1 hypothetical protein BLL52_1096 [Rhodoferax antarcticus ANT.BR]
MRLRPRSFYLSLLTAALAHALPALAADAELDALDLESAPEVSTPAAASNTKVFFEGAWGNAEQRYAPASRALGRASLDLSYAGKLTPDVRAVFSDRLDYMDPAEAGSDATVNSLREAYLSWQPGGGNTIYELGRINLRYGPGYGYNPTDFFRDGSLRTLTSSNPFAMRENRLGSAMLRAQRLWQGGSLSVAYSPKLEDRASPSGWDLDLGATNNRNRGLVALSTQFSQKLSSQWLLYKEQGESAAVGANMTALLSDAAVAHVEWSNASELDATSRALGLPSAATRRNRFAGGVTYTTLGKLSVTAEYQYNGFGASQQDWVALSTAPMSAKVAYLIDARARQELVSRQALMLYVTQKDLFIKDLDLTAFVRFNTEDHSRQSWLELRQHWPKYDLALQWQQFSGKSDSEYGILPDSRIVQVLGNYYF